MTAPRAISDALTTTKRHEARWLAWGFILVLATVIADLIARNTWDRYDQLWDFYVVWEASSITFTIILTIFCWFKYINRGEGAAYTDVLATVNKKIHVLLLIGGSAIALIAAGGLAIVIGLYKDNPKVPIDLFLAVEALCLTLGVVLLVFAELKVIVAVPLAKIEADNEIAELRIVLADLTDEAAMESIQRQLSRWKQKRADYDEILDDVGKFLAFSDAPIAVAFFVIFLVVCAHGLGWTLADSDVLPPFIAGAVALQLLYSNFVFYIEANGEFPKWIRAVAPGFNEVTPMIEGQRLTQNPQVTDQSLSIEPKLITKEPSPASKVPNDS